MSRPHCDCHGHARFADGSDCEVCNERGVFRECGNCGASYDSAEQAAEALSWDEEEGHDVCGKCVAVWAQVALDEIEARRQAAVARLTERKAS